MGKNSLFDTSFPENVKSQLDPSTGPGLNYFHSEFIKLYELDTFSTDAENPYRAVATSLAVSLHIDSILPIILGFLSFIGNMRPEYKRLLEKKDPRALLLLAYWYARSANSRIGGFSGELPWKAKPSAYIWRGITDIKPIFSNFFNSR
jgi:hypothetical protein